MLKESNSTIACLDANAKSLTDGQDFHLICSLINNANPGMAIKNIKSYTAMKKIDTIKNNPQELVRLD